MKRFLIILLLSIQCFGAVGDREFGGNVLPAITDTYDIGSSSLKWEDGFFNGDISAGTFTGDGSALTGIGSGTGGVINTGSTTIGADSDADGSGILVLQTRGITRLTVANNGDIQIAGTITSGLWNGTAIDISSYTNLAAGTNITLSGDTLNVDDAFLVNNASDTTTGVITSAGLTVTTGNALTFGVIQWDDGSDKIEGNILADNSVDDDALDFTSITLADFTADIATTNLTDTADVMYLADFDTFAELQTQIADKTLLNEEDAAIIDLAWTFNAGITGSLTGNVTGDLTGNADTAELLETTRTFSVSGDVTAPGVTFNGNGNVDLVTSFASEIIVNSDISPTATISADKLIDGSTNAIVTLTQETNWDTHLSSDGSDHTFIDQSVISGSSPTFVNTNMTGNISVWTNDSGYLTSISTEEVQDITGGMVTGNVETLIAVTYDDTAGKLDFVVDEASINHNALTNYETNQHFTQLAITQVGTIVSGTWNANRIDISDYTNLAAGTNLTLDNDTINLDDPATVDIIGEATSIADNDFGDVNVVGGVWIVETVAGAEVPLGVGTTGDYVSNITGGTGIDSTGATIGETISHTLSFDATELDALTWSDGSNASNIWTFDVVGTDHTMTAGNGLMSFSNTLSAGTLTDGTLSINSGSITSGVNATFSGTLTLSGLTQGSLLFAGASGVLSEDNSNLFWDDPNNRLGVGTDSPEVKFHIKNSGGSVQLLLQSLATSDATIRIRNGASSKWTFGNDASNDEFIISTGSILGTPKLTILQNGKVGIGTGANAPNAPLEVKGAKPGGNIGGFQSGMFHVTGSGTAQFSNSVITGHSAYNTNTQLWYLGSTSSGNNDIAFINRQNAPIHFYTNNTSRMTIDAVGNVGIGTSSPSSTLDVRGPAGTSGVDAATVLNVTGGAGFSGTNASAGSPISTITGAAGVEGDTTDESGVAGQLSGSQTHSTGTGGKGQDVTEEDAGDYVAGAGMRSGNYNISTGPGGAGGDGDATGGGTVEGGDGANSGMISIGTGPGGAAGLGSGGGSNGSAGVRGSVQIQRAGGSTFIGTTATRVTVEADGDLIIGSGVLYLKETTTPTAIAGHGALYTTSDNELFFQDGAGTEHLLHGDAFSNIWFASPSTVEVTISAQDAFTVIDSFTVVGKQDDLSNVVGNISTNTLTLASIAGGEYDISYHGSITATGGADKNMLFVVGITLATAKDITNVTDNTVSPIVITSVAHGLENGDMVEIVGVLGNTAANGSFYVASKADDTFQIVALDNTATTGNGDYNEGSPTGDIPIQYPGNMMIRRAVRGADLGAISATGFHDLANSDVLKLYVANLDGVTNLTVASISFVITRIGD